MASEFHGLITSLAEFQEALHRAFAEAAAVGCRELWLCDTNFAGWPLGERVVVEHLIQWAGSQRRLTVLATTFDEVVRRHARWVEWRRQWSHVVHCRTRSDLETGRMPSLLLAPGLISVRLYGGVPSRGRWSRDASDEASCRELIDAVLQRSEDAYPVTVTGL